MKYSLDTNTCIAVINGEPAEVRLRLRKAANAGAEIYVSVIAGYELWYGVCRSSRRVFNTERLQSFLSGVVVPLPFDDEDAKVAGTVRAELERSGKPIGAYDVLIAGQALARGLILVTANVSEFSRVRDLRWEDWASA